LFIAIDPDRSKVTNMLTGENVAAAAPTAHAASALAGPPPAPEPPLPTDASTVLIPPVAVDPPAPVEPPVAEVLVAGPAPPPVGPCPPDVLVSFRDPNVLPPFWAEQAEPRHTTTANTTRAVVRSDFTTTSTSTEGWASTSSRALGLR
jgi:hypothetical protein